MTAAVRGEAPATGPNGERLVRCRSCNALMYWGVTPAGKRVPISLQTGETHFRDCPNAQQHTKKKT